MNRFLNKKVNFVLFEILFILFKGTLMAKWPCEIRLASISIPLIRLNERALGHQDLYFGCCRDCSM